MSESKKEVTVKEANKEVATIGTDLPEIPAFQRREQASSDIKIPYIVLMQGSSKKVKTEKLAQAGEIRESIENRLLGDSKKPCTIVPFHYVDTWAIYEEQPLPNGKTKKVYVRMEPRPVTRNVRWDFVEDGKKMVRDACKTIYCLLLEDLKKGDIVPYAMTMRKMSVAGAGSQFEMFYRKLENRGQYIFSRAFEMTSKNQPSKTDPDQNYEVYGIQPYLVNGKDYEVPEAYQRVAYQQLVMIKETMKIDNMGHDLQDDDVDATPRTKETEF